MSKQADDHLKLGWEVISSISGRPRQVTLKRVVSNAYYAMFHGLAESNANLVVGGPNSNRSKGAWAQTYRALGHNETRNKCKNQNMMRRFPDEINRFANVFCAMQFKREEADYNPDHRLALALDDAEFALLEAEEAIAEFHTVDRKDRLAFAVYLLVNLRASK